MFTHLLCRNCYLRTTLTKKSQNIKLEYYIFYWVSTLSKIKILQKRKKNYIIHIEKNH